MFFKVLLIHTISLSIFSSISSAVILSVEDADGSYNIGHQTDARGTTADAVLALLTKSAGWTEDTNPEYVPRGNQQIKKTEPVDLLGQESRQWNNHHSHSEELSVTTSVPYLEILKLIEAFIKVKGEIAWRMRNLFVDNFELIQAVTNVLVSKLSTLHSFTLNGIIILRKILEFAITLFGHWTVSVGVDNESHHHHHHRHHHEANQWF